MCADPSPRSHTSAGGRGLGPQHHSGGDRRWLPRAAASGVLFRDAGGGNRGGDHGHAGVCEPIQREPIEAVYAFPLHERAAVDDYWIHVGERSLHGEIHRRAEAKEIYEDAKAKGQRAGLLEQERPNVFTQSVANIPPGEPTEIQMHMVQPVAQEAGRGTLSLPTVVGPRFIPGAPVGHSGAGVSPDTDEVADASKVTRPVLDPKSRGCALLLITVDIESSLSIGGLASASHTITRNTGNGVTTVELKAGATLANRDFELSWTMGGDATEAAVMTQADEGGGGAFTLTLVPPPPSRPMRRSRET